MGNEKNQPESTSDDRRIIEAAEGRKGIILMPVDAAPINIQNLAPGNQQPSQQAKPADDK
jgi:hypothetical protein